MLCLQSIIAQQTINGKITNTDQQPIAGVQVQIKGTKTGTVTDANGVFHLTLNTTNPLIEITHIGYLPQTLAAKPEVFLAVVLQADIKQLEEVTVSTGYQKISKAQSAGAYEFIDKSKMENKVATDVISQLEGLGSISFDKVNGRNPLSIRGLSTILGPKAPLIVLDNFPYEGNLNNINPNDIESVTVLKDAAAASIWGTKAGNGVIVLTSKKAAFNQPIKVELNTNLTWGEKPRLWERQMISNDDYIDVQQFLFGKGYYKGTETSTSKTVLPGVVEILIKQRDGKISADEATAQMNALRKIDVRNDLLKYWYKPTLNEQVALNLQGGAGKLAWLFSASYDQNRDNTDNRYKRMVLRSDNTLTPLKNLELNLGITYTQSATEASYSDAYLNNITGQRLYPYTRLADDQGNALAITHDYRDGYTDTVGGGKLLDWKYRPLDEKKYVNNHTVNNDLLLNLSVKYSILPGLNAELRYQNESGQSNNNNLQNQQCYYTRDLINKFTQISSGVLTRPVPLGAILDQNFTSLNVYAWRGQLNVNRNMGLFNLNAFTGMERRENHTTSSSFRNYGYNDNVMTTSPVDYMTWFKSYIDGNSMSIPYKNNYGDITNRYISYYANAAVSYANRYTVTASVRKDGSNLFGVEANQKIVPLWSAGFAWTISNEKFFHSGVINYLKLRSSYGYSGNIDNTVSAYTTVSYISSGGINNISYANILTPPNPDLRWEKIGMLNGGLDIGFKNNRISGSLDVYFKRGKDLLGQIPLDPTTGFYSPAVLTSTNQFQYRGNGASLKDRGIELVVHTKNIVGKFSWNTDWIFQFNRSEVTYYPLQTTAGSSIVNNGFSPNPIVGKPVYSLYSYKWGGLDPQTGAPQGYVNGKLSKDYSSMIYNSTISDLQYSGDALPPYFGSLINVFTWHRFSLNTTITWKMGHFFRRNILSYSGLYANSAGAYSAEYARRWQQPGDEKFTQVPAMMYPANSNSDAFYSTSEATIEKADNIRLKDISLSYALDKLTLKTLQLKQLQFYVYANNLGILWKATNAPQDPDSYADIPVSRTIAFGIRAQF